MRWTLDKGDANLCVTVEVPVAGYVGLIVGDGDESGTSLTPMEARSLAQQLAICADLAEIESRMSIHT